MATPQMNLQTLVTDATTIRDLIIAFNNNMRVIDTHDHSSLQGVPVPLSSLVSDSDLNMLNKVLRNARALSFFNQETDYSENNSLYFKNGDLFLRDGGGQVIQLTQNGKIVTGVSNLVTETETVYFGLSGIQASADISEGVVKAQVTTAFNNPANRQNKNVNPLRVGSFVRYQAPNPQGFYYVWFAGLQANINNLKFHTLDGQEDQFWVFVSTVVIGTSNYNLYARRTPISQSQEYEVVVRSYL